MPIVDWSAMDAHAPATDDREALDAFWSSVAYGWLDALRVKLGSRYAVRESEHFLLLSPLEELRARARVVQARPVPVVGMVRRRSGG
jgi:hypothetical protein